LSLCKRLKYHLLNGGVVALSTTRPLASEYTTCSLAPDTEPTIDFSDRQVGEYTFTCDLRAATASGSDFYPLLLPDLLLWLIGDTLLGDLSEGELVPQWTDVSGEENHATQSSGGRMPTFREDAINGHAAVEFGGEDYLITGDIIQPTVGSTFFAVFKRTGGFVQHGAFVGFGQSLATGGTNGSDGTSILEQTPGTLDWFAGASGTTYQSIGGTPTEWNVVTLQFQSTSSLVISLNGEVVGTIDPNNDIEGSDFTRVFVGASNGSGVWYGANCQVAEVIWYGANLSEANRNTVNDYLMAKYAITPEDTTPLTDLTDFNWTAWLAADQESFANNDPVGTASDWSGNNNDATQATGGNKPLFKTNVINSLPAFYFDGTDDVLAFASGAFSGLSSGAEIIAVLKLDSNTPAEANTGLWTMGSSGGGNNTHYPYTDNDVYDDAGSTTRKTIPNPPQDLSVAHIYAVQSAASVWVARINEDVVYSTATNAVGFSTVVSIGKSIGSYYLKGHLAELLIGPALTTNDRQRVIDFLKTKYGIT
jgi:hypothetical protein